MTSVIAEKLFAESSQARVIIINRRFYALRTNSVYEVAESTLRINVDEYIIRTLCMRSDVFFIRTNSSVQKHNNIITVDPLYTPIGIYNRKFG